MLQLCHRKSCSLERTISKFYETFNTNMFGFTYFQINIQPKILFNLCIQPNLLTSCQSCVCFSSAVDKVVVRTIRLLSRQQPAKSGIHYQVYWGAINTQIIFQSRASACTSQSIKNRLLTTFLLSKHFLIICIGFLNS